MGGLDAGSAGGVCQDAHAQVRADHDALDKPCLDNWAECLVATAIK